MRRGWVGFGKGEYRTRRCMSVLRCRRITCIDRNTTLITDLGARAAST
jgi:hypothetical protein